MVKRILQLVSSLSSISIGGRKIEYVRTLHSRKDLQNYLRTLEDVNERSEAVWRANHGGGCPYPIEKKWYNHPIFDLLF